MTQPYGKVYLVGAGPGDPKLITLRGKELLSCADVVIYDYLANPRLLDFASPESEKIYVGKKGGSRSLVHQDKINGLMIEAAQAGKKVVRLKGGDPFLFGRGGEEAEALILASVPFEVVPGVTSAIAVPAYAGIPLTHRECASVVSIVAGHEEPGKTSAVRWNRLVEGSDTLVILMGMANLAGIVKQLLQHGKDRETPIALIQWGSYPYQRTVVGQLANIVEKAQEGHVKPPVVMVIGEVVSFRDKMNGFESRPLFRKKILVTRAAEQALEFTDLLADDGAETISFPTIQIKPVSDWGPLDRAIHQIEKYHAIVFTSVNGVRFFKERLAASKYDLRILKGISLCAIGHRTARAVEALGLRIDLVAREFTAEGLVCELQRWGIAGRRFLIPRAKVARDLLPREIVRYGGTADVIPVYETTRPHYTTEEIEALFEKRQVDMLTFASASTVQNFHEIVGATVMKRFLGRGVIACIGPITADAARRLDWHVDVMPNEYTFPALARAIVCFYRKK